MPYTKIETKHTYNTGEMDLKFSWQAYKNYVFKTGLQSIISQDRVFCNPIKFEVNYPEQGDEIDEREGRKINAKTIKVMFKTEIPKQYTANDTSQDNPLWYLTKGLTAHVLHSDNVDSEGTASASNITGSNYGLPKVNGSAQTTGNFTTTVGQTALGVYYNVPEAQLSTIQGTTTQQTVNLTTPINCYNTITIPAKKFTLKLRVLVVKAERGYFDDALGYSPHKALQWFIKNRVYVGEDPENKPNEEYHLQWFSNTDQILRNDSDYAGQYSILYDKIIYHTVGSEEMISFDLPINQDIQFKKDDTDNIPTNKNDYHILIFPPFTNKSFKGVYGYEYLPNLRLTGGSQDAETIDQYYSPSLNLISNETPYTQEAHATLAYNVKFTYLDF